MTGNNPFSPQQSVLVDRRRTFSNDLSTSGLDDSNPSFLNRSRNSFSDARSVKIGGKTRSYVDSVGSGDLSDDFQFSLKKASRVTLSLQGLSANADLVLFNSEGTAIYRSSQAGTSDEYLRVNLTAGSYYARVFTVEGNTSYRLSMTANKVGRSVPIITAGLANDTGSSNFDGITSDLSIVGNVASKRRIVEFRASIDSISMENSTSILGNLQSDGRFSLSADLVRQLAGASLAEGRHTLYLQARDSRGIVQTIGYQFTFDQVPGQTTLQLSQASDSGIQGDNKTVFSAVTLVGQSEANAIVTLQNFGLTTTADANGQFQFANVQLNLGQNALTVLARDVQGQEASFTTNIERQQEDQNRIIATWNGVLLQAIATARSAPPLAARNIAMVNTAIYDAVNSITGLGRAYRTTVSAPAGASAEAAAAQAAYQVLSSLYSSQQSVFDAALAQSLALIPDGQAETDGINVGRAVANAMLSWRSTDGSTATVTYTPTPGAGYWVPTPPANAPALLPQWPNVTPFTMSSGSQFRPGPPPAYTSAQYGAEIEQVRRIGGTVSAERTAEQTQIANFWADGGGTFTPPGHWISIAQAVSQQKHNTVQENARLFGLLGLAVADAGIVAWDAKYTYNQCRPITAIRDTTPGRPWTADSTWTSLLATPPFPDYISGHSTFSAAASTILAGFYGDNTTFSATAHPASAVPGTVRSFNSFSQAADEAGMSRIYGGIHIMSSNTAGLNSGRSLGSFIFQNFLV